MMKNLTLRNIAAVCGGTYHGEEAFLDRCVDSITTDSRKAEENCLFIPIVGERADGHHFIGQVMEKGALCTLSEKDLGEVGFPYIRVEASLQAVKDIAAFYLKQLSIPVIGITGSVGKTSTKEMIASVLAGKYCVLKTQGNFNNELGLPLTVFRLRDEHELAVLEMGISDFGEMHRLAAIAQPDTCVITNIGSCHLENLGDLDGVLRAKTEVFDHLKPDGTVILNGDDPKLKTVEQVKGKKPLFFGLDTHAAVYADEIENMGLEGMQCRIHCQEENIRVHIPMPGMHMVYNALAGAAVGRQYGLSMEEVKAGIESLQPVSGRFHVISTEKCTIIDDCYNANPMSMKASLGVLLYAAGRRVAVLGDMGELGKNEVEMHREIGRYAAEGGVDLLIACGTLSEYMAEAARNAAKKAGGTLRVVYMQNLDALKKSLPEMLQKGDTLLVKASHFMHFEEIVALVEQQK